jgi:uncharacterized protein (DUF427 family)
VGKAGGGVGVGVGAGQSNTHARHIRLSHLGILRSAAGRKIGVPSVVRFMSARPVLQPTEQHPITVEPTGRHVTVRVNGEVIADSDTALTLQESTYAAVQYIPLADVNRDLLRPSNTATYCPYKGDAGYYSVVTSAGDTVDDAIWTYEEPYDAVAAIAGHVAFYPDKAEISVG